MLQKRTWQFLLVGIGLLVLLMLSLYAQLDLPSPSGQYLVGRTTMRWVDPARQEVLTPSQDDPREVIVQFWYPAEPGTGSSAPYFPGLARVARNLQASGEVSALEVFGLRFIRSSRLEDADLSSAGPAYPVVLLSPGNATNVEFYSGLAEDLASHGYIVVGLNHPYDVAAVELSYGSVAQYTDNLWPIEMEARQAAVQERIEVRVADALFAMDRLQELNAGGDSRFAGRLDLARIGIMGHSLGGITAAQACQVDPRLKACINLDGLQAGGPFSAHPDPELPSQPFMLITKETQLHPKIIEMFERLPSGSYRVVITGARHDHFSDGPLLVPSLLPIPNEADRITAKIRSYELAFFDQMLKGQNSPLLAGPSQTEQVTLEVYGPD